VEAEDWYQKAAEIDYDCMTTISDLYVAEGVELIFLGDSGFAAKTNSRVLQLYDMARELQSTTAFPDIRDMAMRYADTERSSGHQVNA